ncbi:MAG: META domain-containing protein [Stenomitos rutilans HA7619-LM2]|jgi:heat shock protein HslJ|nr:META domain-containing protein [Stenomitos rutilans HA7619-LM2]
MKTGLTMLLGVSIGIAGLNAAIAPVEAVQMDAIAQTDGAMIKPSQPPFADAEWLLEDLNGTGVVDNLQTTLQFDGRDRLSGQGGCNRYMAQAHLMGRRFTVGAIASTKRLCPPAVMDQENRYFQALQNAERVTLEGPYLLVYSQGTKTPLRFTRLTAAQPANETLVTFQGRRNAVRVFTQDGQTRLNVYDKRDRITWIQGTPVKTEQTPEGTRYINVASEASLIVFVPTTGKEPTLTINSKVDR